MGDSFSKVVACLMAAGILFLLPVYIWMQRQEEICQTAILSETMYLVDNVRNTGVLSESMYREYLNRIYNLSGNATIELEIVQEDISYYTRQIQEELESGKKYELSLGDYVRISVSNKDKRVIAYYGGCVKQ